MCLLCNAKSVCGWGLAPMMNIYACISCTLRMPK